MLWTQHVSVEGFDLRCIAKDRATAALVIVLLVLSNLFSSVAQIVSRFNLQLGYGQPRKPSIRVGIQATNILMLNSNQIYSEERLIVEPAANTEGLYI